MDKKDFLFPHELQKKIEARKRSMKLLRDVDLVMFWVNKFQG